MLKDDRGVLTQATAIIRYLGRKAHLYPTCEWQGAKIDEVLNLIEEANPPFVKALITPDGAEKAQRLKELKEEIVPALLGKFERLLELNKGTYLVAHKMTVADLVLWKFVGMIFKDKYYPNQPEEILQNFPRVLTNFNAVNTAPKVKAWKKLNPELYYY